MLTHIQNNPSQNTKQIKEALNIPQRSLERYLKKLRDADMVEFRGAPKTGGYHVTESDGSMGTHES